MASRIFGLSGSGLDIDSIVANLMKAERAKQDKLKQKQTIAEWQRSDFRDLNNSLRSLRDNVFNLKLQSTFLAKKVTSSNENVVKATAISTAPQGINSIIVNDLANSARLTSTSAVTFDSTKKTLVDQISGIQSGELTFCVNGSKPITINTTTEGIDELVSKINSARKADGSSVGVTAFFDKTLQKMYISSTSTGTNAMVDFTTADGQDALNIFNKLNLTVNLAGNANYSSSADTAFSSISDSLGLATAMDFTINGKIVSLTTADTVETLIDKINNSGSGILASFSNNRFYFASTDTSINAKIDFATADGTDTNGLFAKMQLSPTLADGSAEVSAVAAKSVITGSNASVTINGETISQQSNQFTIAGINYTLVSKSATPVTTTVSNDTDAVYNSIKGFVDLYNTTMEKVYAELSEEKYKNYLPLTDDQREQLSDDQEKQWEEKAKSGLLKNDSLLGGAADKIRSTINSIVSENNFKSLSSIGITTGTYEENGKLYIDEQKLRNAISGDPMAVMNLFTKNTTLSVTSSSSISFDPNVKFSDASTGINLTDSDSFSFTLNGKSISVTGADTIDSLVSKINDSGAGITAYYNIGNKKLYFSTSGTTTQIDFATADGNDSANLFLALRLSTNANFNLTSGNVEAKVSDIDKGLGVRLYDNLTNSINQIISKAGSNSSFSLVDNSYLGKQIKDYDKQIDDWDTRLQEIEDRYYKQYAAMEQALSKLNQQSSWFAQQFQ